MKAYLSYSSSDFLFVKEVAKRLSAEIEVFNPVPVPTILSPSSEAAETEVAREACDLMMIFIGAHVSQRQRREIDEIRRAIIDDSGVTVILCVIPGADTSVKDALTHDFTDPLFASGVRPADAVDVAQAILRRLRTVPRIDAQAGCFFGLPMMNTRKKTVGDENRADTDAPTFRRRRAEVDKTETIPSPITDNVHFSVVSPPTLLIGSHDIIDVWAYRWERRAEAIRAAERQATGEVRVITQGPAKVLRGSVLGVRLRIDGVSIDESEKPMMWAGDLGNAVFLVRVLSNAKPGVHRGRAQIYLSAFKIAEIEFCVELGKTRLAPRHLAANERRRRSAFASYASKDRAEVLKRVQALEKTVEVYIDVKELRSGQRYERLILEMIPSKDVFYLFWSKAARKSKWVEKEWRCALEAKGIDFIDPIPLDPPEKAPPPPELADKLHFNDWMLAYIADRRRFSHAAWSLWRKG